VSIEVGGADRHHPGRRIHCGGKDGFSDIVIVAGDGRLGRLLRHDAFGAV
jgi:hypothetical protein